MSTKEERAKEKKSDLRAGFRVSERYSELQWHGLPLEASLLSKENRQSILTDSVLSAEELSVTEEGETTPHLVRRPINAATTALLVVDVQPEYWSGNPAVSKDFPNFPEKLSKTVSTCRERGAKLIFVRADYRLSHSPWLKQFAHLHEGLPNFRTELPCEPGSEEFGWEPFATPRAGEVILPKSSWSSTSNPRLLKWLRDAGIDTVLVCGLITSVCVQHTAYSIFDAGFRTLLVEDACGDRGRARHEAALALYGDYMYEVISADSLSDPKLGMVAADPIWMPLSSDEKEPVADDVTRWVDKAKSQGVRLQRSMTGASIVLPPIEELSF